MSWSETLLDASYRGSDIQVIEETLQAQRSLAEHGTPFQDGDSVVDLGRGARKFQLRLVCWGDNYEIQLQDIISALDIPGPGELVHPIYGVLSVVANTWEVKHHAEMPDYAEVIVLFVEDTPDTPLIFRPFGDITGSETVYIDDGPSWQDGVFELFGRIDSLVSEIQSWIGGGWVGLIEKALGLPGISLRFAQLRSQILGVVSGVASMFKHSSAAFDPLHDLFRTPTEIRSAIQGGTPTTATALLSKSGLPITLPGADGLTPAAARVGAAFLVSARQGTEPDADLLPLGMPTDPVEANAFALLVLVITELALAHAQAVAVIIEEEATTPTLSPLDLEGLVNLVRSLVQSAILIQRRLYDVETSRPVIEALRNTAALIQVRARQVILLRPPMVDRIVETPASLRLLAHRWYGDHTRAVELIRLNPGLKTPHNINAGEVLRAYAE
ncbi:DNA circularization protein [Pseudomonas sp. DSP3-2-2]|uniref:DNA circularization protein n=1 Tax=unclassified Pseudomonas TaxID=196821 RepID=UPI003CE9145D